MDGFEVAKFFHREAIVVVFDVCDAIFDDDVACEEDEDDDVDSDDEDEEDEEDSSDSTKDFLSVLACTGSVCNSIASNEASKSLVDDDDDNKEDEEDVEDIKMVCLLSLNTQWRSVMKNVPFLNHSCIRCMDVGRTPSQSISISE